MCVTKVKRNLKLGGQSQGLQHGDLRQFVHITDRRKLDLTHLLSDSNNSFRASVWNLLSQRYNDVLIGLKGSKSMLTFFSLPSSVKMVPV